MSVSRCLLFVAGAGLAVAALPAHAFETKLERDGVTLSYVDASDALDASMRERIIDTFFNAYARQRADYNPASPQKASITIDPAYSGVAYVSDKGWASMTINPGWLKQHPADVDLVTHEAMHIVQSYPNYGDDKAPSWLVEGIADFARDHYGLDNAAGGWALPQQVKQEQNFDTGYRVTGAFLKWGESRHPGLVKALDHALRQGQYGTALWQQQTGQPLPALWQQYVSAQGGYQPAG